MTIYNRSGWQSLCSRKDLVADGGIACWTEDGPVAVFWLPDHEPSLFAISHHDPISQANVLARGIVGDRNGEPMVASPLFKQHFRLTDGQCLEDPAVAVSCYDARLNGDKVEIALAGRQEAAA